MEYKYDVPTIQIPNLMIPDVVFEYPLGLALHILIRYEDASHVVPNCKFPHVTMLTTDVNAIHSVPQKEDKVLRLNS